MSNFFGVSDDEFKNGFQFFWVSGKWVNIDLNILPSFEYKFKKRF